jgi:D-3-phosphoglycerate dehydrogenase
MIKVLVSSDAFGLENPNVFKLLRDNNIKLILNPYKRLLKECEMLDLIDKDIVGIIAGLENISENIIRKAQSLRVISRYGIGLDNIDIKTCKKYNILIYNTKDSPTLSVAELTISLILNLLRNINKLDKDIKSGYWRQEVSTVLTGKIVGIIGLGRIGKKLVELLEPFRVKILAYDIEYDKDFNLKYNIKTSSLDNLLKNSDIVTLHLPSTISTKNLLGKKEFSKMKNNAILINTGRGDLISEYYLYDSLKKNSIAGAAIDVFKEEPYRGKLIELNNVILTPHIGTATKEARSSMDMDAANNLIHGLKRLRVL